jgi:hypothetical protein
MGRAQSLTITIAALAAVLAAGPAVAAEDAATKLCGAITDSATAYIRAGRLDRARVLKPFLEECGPILKAAVNREVGKLLELASEPAASAPK